MLSYRHSFHAGNHADILKHTTLCIILNSLLKKDKPFTVFDTHSGAGIYNLDDKGLLHTEEAIKGILKLLNDTNITENPPDSLKTYISLCKTYKKLGLYPGSPEIERCLMRKQDKLFLAELHNTEIEILRGNLSENPLIEKENGNPSITIQHTDGFQMLKSHVPPLVKRGLIITDPSYETTKDYTETAKVLINAYKKWNTAIIALWFPLLEHRKTELSNLLNEICFNIKNNTQQSNIPEITYAELCINSPTEINSPRLYGSGMLIINSPYLLDVQLRESLPKVVEIISPYKGTWKVENL